MKKVIVIGGGLGGISAAVSLALDGFQVELFEKNAHIGGKLNLLQADGFSFDLGPSILTMPHIFERLFSRAGKRMADYVETVEPHPHWRNFFEDGTVIDLHPTPEETVHESAVLMAEDAAQLRRFLAYSKRLYEATERGYFDRGLDTLWSMVRFHGVLHAIRDFDIFSTVDKGVRRHVENRYLRDILNFFVKYVGSSPYDAPALLNLLFYVQCDFGLWYVRGGLFNLAKALARLLQEVGVSVSTSSEVVELSAREGNVIAARLKDGRTVQGDLFVCNMEVIPAYRRLLNESRSFLRRYDKYEPACSGLVLHLGVKGEYPQLAHHNFFYSRDPEAHFASVFHQKVLPEDPTLYVVAPARTDKTQAPEGCENIKVLPHIPHLQDPPFSAEEYARLRDRVLEKLERMGLRDLRKRTIVEDMWTPEDIERRYCSNRGAIYGVVSDRKANLGFKAPKRSEKYRNLYFVGGSVNPGGGMPMAVLSGQQVHDKILEDLGEAPRLESGPA